MGKKKKVKPPKKKTPRVKSKLRLAQQRNTFLRQVEEIAEATGTLAAFQLIPPKVRPFIAQLRIHPFQVEAAPDQDLPPELLTIARQYIQDTVKYESFITVPDGGEISRYDYFRVVFTLFLYVNALKGDEYKTANEVKKGFAPFLEFVEHGDEVNKKLDRLGNEVGLFFSRINQSYYWSTHGAAVKDAPQFSLHSYLYLHRQKAEKINVYLDGIKRPVYRLGWSFPNEGVRWSTVKAGDLGVTGSFADLPLTVYVQSHALIRLSERVDWGGESAIHFFLWEAFSNIRPVRMQDNQVMIEYRFFEHKIGYLVIDLVEDKVIVRTFLFLTNIGTPEGDHLKKRLGLKLCEQKFLILDKLSTFILTDLKDDPELIEIFTHVGCGSLFALANQFTDIDAKMQYAQKLAKYLRLHEEFEY